MSRKSAFSVFHSSSKEYKLKKGSEEQMDIAGSPPDIQHEPSAIEVAKKERRSLSPPTITERIPKHNGKSEPRLNALRKSLKKKQKKDDGNTKENGKENKIHKVFSQSNWAEKLEKLDNLTLEEHFLPEVTKQRKEQEELHNIPVVTNENTNVPKSIVDETKNRKRCYSSPETVELGTDKQLINMKRFSEKRRMRRNSTSDKQIDKEDEKVNSNGAKVFEWLIAPINPEQFCSDVWQKKPCLVKRRQTKYNQIWFSTKELDKILRTQNVQFTKNLDIAIYRDGKRETLNPEGRAFAPAVWKFYEEGCSIRLINPQTFSRNVWHLSSKLQEFFGCFIGSNVYLTPPGSQGFAPHYDDIEAFVIQLEGRKQWRLYPTRNLNEILARYSSHNLTQEELGEPILDRILEPGDTLYFPRGVIHQAVTPDDSHSLHITVSCYQKYSWSDYMEKLIPIALQTAIEEDAEFRKGLPIGCHTHVGISNSEKNTAERKAFMKTVQQLMKKLVSNISIDVAADELVLDQLDEFLPPCLTSEESNNSVFGNGAFWDGAAVSKTIELDLDSEVKIMRPGIARLITDEDGTHIHHTLENSRQYKEVPLKRVEIPVEMASAAAFLLFSQDYVKIKDAPLESNESKLSLANQLYNIGLLRTKLPLM